MSIETGKYFNEDPKKPMINNGSLKREFNLLPLMTRRNFIRSSLVASAGFLIMPNRTAAKGAELFTANKDHNGTIEGDGKPEQQELIDISSMQVVAELNKEILPTSKTLKEYLSKEEFAIVSFVWNSLHSELQYPPELLMGENWRNRVKKDSTDQTIEDAQRKSNNYFFELDKDVLVGNILYQKGTIFAIRIDRENNKVTIYNFAIGNTLDKLNEYFKVKGLGTHATLENTRISLSGDRENLIIDVDGNTAAFINIPTFDPDNFEKSILLVGKDISEKEKDKDIEVKRLDNGALLIATKVPLSNNYENFYIAKQEETTTLIEAKNRVPKEDERVLEFYLQKRFPGEIKHKLEFLINGKRVILASQDEMLNFKKYLHIDQNKLEAMINALHININGTSMIVLRNIDLLTQDKPMGAKISASQRTASAKDTTGKLIAADIMNGLQPEHNQVKISYLISDFFSKNYTAQKLTPEQVKEILTRNTFVFMLLLMSEPNASAARIQGLYRQLNKDFSEKNNPFQFNTSVRTRTFSLPNRKKFPLPDEDYYVALSSIINNQL